MAEEAWKQLASALTARRVQLGYTVRDKFASAAGVHAKILFEIENAKRTNYSPATLAQLEQGYELQTGSIARFLDGDKNALEPAPESAVAAGEFARRIPEAVNDLPRDIQDNLLSMIFSAIRTHAAQTADVASNDEDLIARYARTGEDAERLRRQFQILDDDPKILPRDKPRLKIILASELN